ncbi:DUF2274 domain-containing protein [Asticcacaulis endophyticus]|uniref:DUF2274 domain-containing protein n=1 Tax=Asticcacaulis endophyticus TaxID=1395890 RepID=A0A918USL9_9CAUL|nr:DUF2274 domain-containing protein [Asticcacaulis endophyticus]GGZ32244.1 hypothetical protein GCM10011273_17920 [Asticcacaulis endophyticus]
MSRLKLGPLTDDKPVKITVELPAATYRSLEAYAEALASETALAKPDPVKLIAPMIDKFIGTDRAFSKLRRR